MDAQRTDEWFAARCGKLTASRFSDVMNVLKSGEAGANRKNLIVTLALERLTGSPVETFQNDAMRRGTELEPEARSAYEAHTGELVEEVAFIQHRSVDYIGVSPDGLVDKNGMVEFKCPASPHKHMNALLYSEHATEYKWQLQGQLWVAEREWNEAVSYDPRFPEHLRLAITRVYRDEKAISLLADECEKVNEEIELTIIKLQQRKAA